MSFSIGHTLNRLPTVFHLWMASLCVGITIACAAMPAFAADVALPSVRLQTADATWRAYLAATPGSEEHAALFETFGEQLAELGIVSTPVHAATLLHTAGQAVRAGDTATGQIGLAHARLLAPDLAQPHFFEAWLAAQRAPWRVDRIGPSVLDGFTALRATASGRSTLASHLLLYALRGFLVVATLVVLAFLVRHGTRVAHDVRLLLRRGPELGQALALVSLLALAPALVLWSPTVFIICGCAIVAPYLMPRERACALLILVGIALFPTLSRVQATQTYAALRDASDVADAIVSRCDANCVADLEAGLARGDRRAELARAWVHFKNGTDDERRRAAARIEGWSDDASLPADLRASAAILEGNLAFAEGELDAAAAGYESAQAHADTGTLQAAAWIGAYRVHAANALQSSAQTAASNAERADLAFASHYLGLQGNGQNRVLPVGPIARSVMTPSREQVTGLAQERMQPFLGDASSAAVFGASVLVLLWTIVSVAASRRRLVACRCARCATPISRFVFEPAYEAKRCVLCHQLDVARSELSSRQVSGRQARVADWRETAPRLGRIANAAAPGFGWVIAGWTFRGVLVLGLFVFGVIFFITPGPAAGLPETLAPSLAYDGSASLGGLALAIAYLVALLGSSRAVRQALGDDPTESQSGPAPQGNRS